MTRLSAKALFDEGNNAFVLGKLIDAKEFYKKTIVSNSNFLEGHYNLGITYKKLGKFKKAEQKFKETIKINSKFLNAYKNLCSVLQVQKKFDELEIYLKILIKFNPKDSISNYNLSLAQQNLNKLNEAKVSLEKSISLDPNFFQAYYNLGIILKKLRKTEESIEVFKSGLNINPNFIPLRHNLGALLIEVGKSKEAIKLLNKTIEINPNHPYTYNNLGIAQKNIGDIKNSNLSFKKAIQLKPNYSEAHRHITMTKKFLWKDEQFLQMQKIYINEKVTKEEKCHICFGLAKACKDLNEFETAFKYFREGNKLRKKHLNYNIHQDIQHFNKLKFNYSQIPKISVRKVGLTNDILPIFIVGMPRSGTTLVEQIISSHSKVQGGGELPFIGKLGGCMANGLENINENKLINFRQNYLERLKLLSNNLPIITDKFNLNFRYIGLISNAFPEAKIIHVKRNPAATCWSNFEQYFPNGLGYSYDLTDIINYYYLYEELMNFWINSTNCNIYYLDYELLVKNQEKETKKLVDYLEINWDGQCLSPHKNKRIVTTASNSQIRKKVYVDSSQNWKKFKPFLEGKLDKLDY